MFQGRRDRAAERRGLSCGAATASHVSNAGTSTPDASEVRAAQQPHPAQAHSCTSSGTGPSARAWVGAATMTSMQRRAQFLALPDSALVACFKCLPPAERRGLALVCRRFRAVAEASCDLWEQVQLSFPADFQQTISMADLYAWFVRREGVVRSLHVDISTAAAWPAILAVLGVVGRGLEHLRLAGDTEECQTPGCTAPWLALVPNLLSLELDEVVDHSIGDARFPPGLTRLELSYCGEEGLYSIPAKLGQCTRLHTLALQCAMFDNELTMDRLATCTSIEHLDLSNCCLTRVPPVLATLPRLTNLTLNENDGLGASEAALAPLALLSRLQVLEMRECGLKDIPQSVTGLTSLKSLLLGYNNMTKRPCIPAGPYLSGLRVLAMSDATGFQDDVPFDVLADPLEAAHSLEVLRICRCMGLQLSIEDVRQLLSGKPRFRKLEFSADMLSDPRDLEELRRLFPHINFKAVD